MRRAITVFEKATPDGLSTAAAYQELGEQLLQRGDLVEAESLQQRALGIRTKAAPGSLTEGDSHQALAFLAFEQGDLSRTEAEGRLALSLREKSAPGTTVEAETLHLLGRVRWRAGDSGGAADLLCRAVEALENQRTKLGGTEGTHAAFAARFADVYRDYVAVLVELGRREDAFRVLERSRAREFLSMLAERDVAFTADIPRELAEESKRIGREYDQVMSRLGAASGAQRDTLTSSLRDLRRKAEDVTARVRSLSPRLAALRDPVPLGVEEARAALDPGTTLLSFCVGRDRTLLFVISREAGLEVVRIDVSREELVRRIDALRAQIEIDRSQEHRSARLLRVASDLFRDLIAPASPLLRDARRLLVSPDGALHRLPFAALVKETSASGTPKYLVAWKPIHTVLSATVYEELRKRRAESSPRGSPLAAFGNPSYRAQAWCSSSGPIADRELRSVVNRGFAFEPLPSTELEVRKIASLFGEGAHQYLGEAATEEQAKKIGRGVGLIHFACHSTLDEQLPLNSALVLSLPDDRATSAPGARENGLLQAWEILDGMRIDADLVTLSACQTGLGLEMGGEGLVGLTRAFQYAGARSVLASLWRVADDSTAELMTRFYGHVKEGKTKDEALRSAQLELIRSGGRLGSPFAWAAFQLAGDFR